MADSAKCAHPSCECFVDMKGEYGKYCSEPCKKAGQITELHCNCGHSACRHPELPSGQPENPLPRPRL